jgi:hypothetical protein
MSGSQGWYTRKPLVLDTSGDEADGADKVASGLEGLTIVSSADDTGWVGVKGQPERPPLLAPARTHGAACTLSSSLSILSALTEPPSICLGAPLNRAAGMGGGLTRGFHLWKAVL